ncbi:hypothetical protein AOQ84DRAFT_415628 [Glonium stellatum]|uniref:Rhodopsin domain-containing protein n=1 Tax=Glonium stellatum TaxID=574774 RepID=A0A8E2JPI7_9PEZI|nr:hypothetical protein AOQ84DRAFT_415628 [Glonium stellatum]
MTALGSMAVLLHIITRQFIVRNFGADDWMMVAAMILALGYLAQILALRGNGMGFSGTQLKLDQMINLIKITLGIEITYYCIVFCIKVSIIFFYLRIAANRLLRILCRLTIGLLFLFVIVCVIVCLTQCNPLHKMWDFTGLVKGTSAFNIITDIWIIGLPVKTLLKIQRPRREKIALFVVFGMGIFSCIASIVRLQSIRTYTLSADPFYDSVQINLWSIIEVNIGIICASIPALKPLISRGQHERARVTTRRSSRGYAYYGRDKSGSKKTEEDVSTDSSQHPHQSHRETYKMDSFVAGQSPAKANHTRTLSKDATPRILGSSQEQILSPMPNVHLR